MRLDLYLHTLYPQFSKRQWGVFLDQDQLVVDTSRDKNPLPLSKGTNTNKFPQGWIPRIDWEGIAAQIDWKRPEAKISVQVIYEDQLLLLVHKPPALACHPNHPRDPETLVDQVRKVSYQPSTREGFLLHRLDLETSGLVGFAKTKEAYDRIVPMFRSKSTNLPRLTKTYHARVWGTPPWTEYRCSIPLAHSRQSNQRVVPVPQDKPIDYKQIRGTPRPAETRFRVLAQDSQTTLLEATIETGMMHQIRVHCASLGYPILGDKIYGRSLPTSKPWNTFPYHLLDCWKITMDPWEWYPKGLRVLGPVAQWSL